MSDLEILNWIMVALGIGGALCLVALELVVLGKGDSKSERSDRLAGRGAGRLGMYAAVGCLVLCGCATTPDLPANPPKYVYSEGKSRQQSKNSLWVERAGLYEDNKARRVNDLVTIKVVENISGAGKGDTQASKDAALDGKIDSFFGNPIIYKNFWGNGYNFEPKVQGSMSNEFQGKATTTREGKIVGTITAKVTEVMPNGNLVIESRKDIVINNEKQILILRGMLRPDDIATDNSVLSNRVADAEIYFVGKGVIQEKQSPGWMARFLDRTWPF